MPRPLKTSEKNRFARMREKVARPSSNARATSPSRSLTSTTSAASIAICAPAPTATPRSAAASAGPSFTPSPTMATVRPSALRAWIFAAFSPGCTRARTRSTPTAAATERAVRSLSPVSIHTCSPWRRSRATAARASGRGASARPRKPTTASFNRTKTTVAPDASNSRAAASSQGPGRSGHTSARVPTATSTRRSPLETVARTPAPTMASKASRRQPPA
mmetsp:Transcript_16482/g.49215  ORF Transcript_16482/g.49215 Transcript_16482/m.49215 type:complete len:219 (-) Transcript_16482:1574-2230(-)